MSNVDPALKTGASGNRTSRHVPAWAVFGAAAGLALTASACGSNANAPASANTATAAGAATPSEVPLGATSSASPSEAPYATPPAASPSTEAPRASATPLSTLTAAGKTYPEIVDHKPAIALYANTLGSLANGSLNFGTTVEVQCFAPNETGEASIDPGFYRFDYGGQTLYAISNQFANGDPVGVSGYNTTVDPAVPQCPAE